MDKELRQSLDEINAKIDKLASEGGSEEKQKYSVLKRVTIAIPIAVAVIGLVGTGYELSLKFIESHNNRKTIQYYTSLAKNFAENAEDESAQSYLARATEIDPNNADLVATTAFVDILTLLRRRGVDELLQGTYDLSALKLNPEEIYYQIGKTAAEDGRIDVAEDYLRRIKPARTRLSLLARSKLIGEVYLRSLNLKEAHAGHSSDHVLADATQELKRFAEDIQEFHEDPDLVSNLRNQMCAFGYAVMFRLPENELVSLQTIFSRMEPPDEEFLGALGGQLEVLRQDSASSIESEDKILQSLLAAQVKSQQDSSFLARQVDDAIARYSARIELRPEPIDTNEQNDLEARRKRGKQKGSSGEFDEANKIFLDIVNEYQKNQLEPDETLYKTYFNLALLNEYSLNRIKQAIDFYDMAEKLAVALELKDPTIHNTFGYLYYKLGRDSRELKEKSRYLNLARDKLSYALVVEPEYAKSRRTLTLVDDEFKALEQTKAAQQKRRSLPIRDIVKKEL